MSALLKACLTSTLVFAQIYLSAQDKSENYINGTISETLTKDADAVCRLEEYDIEIKSPGKIVVKERHIYTILNENADKLSTYKTYYDKLSTINYVEGTLYNAQPREINHFKKKDMQDYAVNSAAFVSDERVKVSGFTYNSYPYSLIYEEEDEKASAMFLHSWSPPRSSKISVEVSRYILTVPAEYKFRYKMINSDIKPLIVEKKDKITYTWELRNLPVIPHEPFAIDESLYNPTLLVGPTHFELQGYTGDMTDWGTYGKFYSTLQKGRDVLPDDLKLKVHELTDSITDPRKKISFLYDYLQRNTHYVLIMFGIGGLQTYDANYVAKNKYGDCKALSNFMIALLKEAGIKANAVIIRGDPNETEFYPDFPSHQFNHVICAVPLIKDTVWLECTDQYLPAGYLGVFTANRYGLFVDDRGGTLVHTPVYSIKENVSIRKLQGTVDLEGNLQIRSEAIYKALSHDPLESISHHYNREQQLEYLKGAFNLPTFTVDAFNFTEDYSSSIPVMKETLDITVTNYAHITGRRLFLNPNILRRSTIKISEEKGRSLDFQFRKDFRETDSTEIIIPEGYETESRPNDQSLITPYGRYFVQIIVSPGKIKYFRQFEQFRGRFSAKSIDEISAFYNSIYNTDHSQIVLVKKN